MDAIEKSLQGIEARMRIEARQWKDKSREAVPDTDQLRKTLLALTGLSIRTKSDQMHAGRFLQRLLTAQRRMAKSGHPRYDPNRHILLKAALDSFCMVTGDKPPAEMCSARIRPTGQRANVPANPGKA